MINLVLNDPRFVQLGHTTVIVDIGNMNKWLSKCNCDEVESKNDFEERHSARDRSNKMGFAEGRREGEPGQRSVERVTALFYRNSSGPFQGKR